jgi:hypothetical protein
MDKTVVDKKVGHFDSFAKTLVAIPGFAVDNSATPAHRKDVNTFCSNFSIRKETCHASITQSCPRPCTIH